MMDKLRVGPGEQIVPLTFVLGTTCQVSAALRAFPEFVNIQRRDYKLEIIYESRMCGG